MPYPSYLAQNLIGEAQDVVGRMETIFSTSILDATKAAAFVLQVPVAPAVSATTPAATAPLAGLYAGLVAIYNAIPMLVSDLTGVDPALPLSLLALARGLGQTMDPGAAAAAFAQAADDLAEPPAPLPEWTQNRVVDNANAALMSRIARACFLTPYVEALATQSYRTRADAITAKADCVSRFERELELCNLGDDIAFAETLTGLRDAAVDYLASVIIDARPVLIVTTPLPIPALVAEWRIYATAGVRADELCARNDIKLGEFMPTTFEALAA